jgi:hypothetical protein
MAGVFYFKFQPVLWSVVITTRFVSITLSLDIPEIIQQHFTVFLATKSMIVIAFHDTNISGRLRGLVKLAGVMQFDDFILL